MKGETSAAFRLMSPMLPAAGGAAIRKPCEAASQTVAEVVPVIFGRRIDDPQKLVFGFGEALAYVNFMAPETVRIADASWRLCAQGGDVVQRIRDLTKKASTTGERVGINAAIHEVIDITRSEAMKNGVIKGDRVELQQMITIWTSTPWKA
jgi:hypothetical protein